MEGLVKNVTVPMRLIAFTLIALLAQQSVASADIYASAPYYYWSPAEGKLWVLESSGTRYSWTDFYWGTPGRHSALTYEWNGTSAYEHEVIFYNYAGQGFGHGATSFSSNLPDTRYLDEGLFNNENEVTIEIGTTRGDLIADGVGYYADAVLIRGGSEPKTKLRTVRGARLHTCPYPYCVAEVDGRIVTQNGVTWWYSSPGTQRTWLDP